ncbi:MAG: putative Ig domain-containing protein [Gammaproteobacteria bacterium]
MIIRIWGILLFLVTFTTVSAAPIQFEDKSDKLGFTRGTESWGIAWGNLNGDKWPDLWNSGHRDFPRLYRNTGTGDFDDVTMFYDRQMNGYWISDTQFDVHGGAWGDFDNDGDDDIIVGDEDELFINQSTLGRFFRKSSTSTSQNFAAWNNTDSDRNLESDTSCLGQYILLFDLDADGDIEKICADEGTFPREMSGASSRLIPTIGLSNDAALGDFNNDLRTDIIVTRGALRPAGVAKVNSHRIEAWFRGGTGAEFSFISTGGEIRFLVDGHSGGAFLKAEEFNLNTNSNQFVSSDRGASISYDAATSRWRIRDTGDRQAYVRIIAQNPIGMPVMSNLENGDLPQPTYHGVNSSAGINWVFGTGLGAAKSCVSVVAADFDNDMDMDLYMACRSGVRNLANRYFDNQGDGTFKEVTAHGGEGPVGAGDAFGLSDSVITADYDVDGFMDLTAVNGLLYFPVSFGGPDTLLRNRGNGNHWIEIDLQGTVSPRAAIGAKVFVTAGGITQLREQTGGYHRWSQNHSRIHVGLAGNTIIDRIRIEWPSGQTDNFTNIAADQLYTAIENGILSPVGSGTPVHVTFAPGEECGEPAFTETLGPALLVWRDCGTDNWHLRVKGGLDRLTENRLKNAVGQIVADTNFGFANPVAASGNDFVIRNTPNIVDFSLSVNVAAGNNKGINFSTPGQLRTCLSVDGDDFEAVYLGNTGKRIDLPFDLSALGACNMDFDGDGLNDDVDPDDDNDSVLDVNDAFPLDASESVDTDGDGIGNNRDTDDDNDGVLDGSDAFPLDDSETIDTDNDGIGNNADSDDDGDGVADSNDAFPLDPTESRDSDGDGVGDNSDPAPNDPTIPNAPNTVPLISQPGDQSVTLNDQVNLIVTATIPTNESLAFTASGLPPGLSISPAGAITGQASVSGQYAVAVTVTDQSGDQDITRFAIVVSSSTTTLISENFNAGSGGFDYRDNTFRNARQSSYASGSLSGGSLNVELGGRNNNDIFGMSGGWQRNFQLVNAGRVSLSFRYRLTQASDYESDEYSEALLSVDGSNIGAGANDYIARITGNGNGGSAQTTGWQTFTVDLGNLSTGQHSFVIGAYNNKKTWSNEITTVSIDDVTLTVAGSAGGNNTSPVLGSIAAQTHALNTQVSLQAVVTDSDNDPLQIQALGLPNGLSINAGTGLISGTASLSGAYRVTVVAYDGRGGSNLQSFNWQITDTQPPVNACGEPAYNSATEPGVYLWQDCTATGDAHWLMHVVGGGLSWQPYQGQLDSMNPVTANGFALEAHDTLDAISGDNAIDFTLNVARTAIDGIDFLIPANSQTCFDIQVKPQTAQVYVGRNRHVFNVPFNLENLGACQ